jgi:hypothetical protein
MPRGVSNSAIRDKRKSFVKQKIREIETVSPAGLKTLMSMVIGDLRKEDYRMASARCRSAINQLDQSPNLKKILSEVLPDFALFLQERGYK